MKAEPIGGLESESILSLCLRGKIWKYRGEGNANIVLALPKERLILRLHKWEREKDVTSQIEYEEEQRVWREVVFCRSVMVPLLGSAYIQPAKPARLEDEIIYHLDMALKPLRPVYRTHKGIKFCYVTIYPDYALLPFGFKNATDNMVYDYNNYKSLPLQSIENQNYYCLEDTSSNIYLKKIFLCPQKRNGTKYLTNYDNQLSNEENSDDDSDVVFIENNINVNEGLNASALSSVHCKLERLHHNLNSPLYISNKTRGSRRFSTGSDYNVILPNEHHKFPSSAPVYSQFIFDFDCQNNPVFCIEIKPKQGWIPLMDRYNPKCTFCLNQYLKLSKGLIKSFSQYCPLDLFSGDKIRMKNALKCLLATPQNNLKLFRDGVLVYSDDSNSEDLFPVLQEWLKSSKQVSSSEDIDQLIDKFCDLVLNALTTDLTQGEKLPVIEDILVPDCPSVKESYKIVRDIWPSSPMIKTSSSLFDLSSPCDWNSQQLPSNCILDRILKIQQLEQSGADAVFNIFKSIYPEENDYDYVNKLYDQTENVLRLDPVQRYLLATTAKDCSILIAFQRANWKDNCSQIKAVHKMKDADGINYVWNVGISDLDPKPLSCIRKHRKRDADVISSYIDYFKNL